MRTQTLRCVVAVHSPIRVPYARLRCTAFTLLELLVSVAVIGVMAATLLPSLTKARGVSNSMRCAATQSALFKGLMGYQADYTMQPNLSCNRADDGIYGPADPTSGCCVWGQSYTNPGSNEAMGLGQMLGGNYIAMANLFCPENSELGEQTETPERHWFARQFLYGLPYVAGGPAGDAYVKSLPQGDGLGLPQPNTASLYFRSHYLYRSGDWSFTTSLAATTGTAQSGLNLLRSDADGYSGKLILMDFRQWYHERNGSGLNETWGDGSVNFKRNANVNAGNIPAAWRTYGGVTYLQSGSSALRNGMSYQGCAYFDKWEQSGR